MNYRRLKKLKRKSVIREVKKLSPQTEDIIALYYPYGEIPYDQLVTEYKYIKRNFKDSAVVALPDITKIDVCSEKDIINVIESLQAFLENKKAN